MNIRKPLSITGCGLALALLFASRSSSAQSIHMAIEGGVQVSNVYTPGYEAQGWLNDWRRPSKAMVPGVRVGFSGSYGVTKNLRVCTGLFLHTVGGQYDGGSDFDIPSTFRYRFVFLEVPLHLQYHFNAYATRHPFIGAGIGYNLMVGELKDGLLEPSAFGAGKDLVAEVTGGYHWGKAGFIKLQAGTGLRPVFPDQDMRTRYRASLTVGAVLF